MCSSLPLRPHLTYDLITPIFLAPLHYSSRFPGGSKHHYHNSRDNCAQSPFCACLPPPRLAVQAAGTDSTPGNATAARPGRFPAAADLKVLSLSASKKPAPIIPVGSPSLVCYKAMWTAAGSHDDGCGGCSIDGALAACQSAPEITPIRASNSISIFGPPNTQSGCSLMDWAGQGLHLSYT